MQGLNEVSYSKVYPCQSSCHKLLALNETVELFEVSVEHILSFLPLLLKCMGLFVSLVAEVDVVRVEVFEDAMSSGKS